MSIMDMFRSKPAEPVVVPPTVDPSLASPGTAPGAGTPKSDGSVLAIPKAGEGDKSPLANYGDLWQTSTDPKDKNYVKPPATTATKISADPAKMMEAAKTVDFTKVLSPELQARLAKAEPAAIVEAMNTVAQATYAQAAGAATHILNSALEAQAKTFRDQVMPEILRNHSVSQQLRTDNPLFDNPAVSPVLKMVERQLVAKNPTLSPVEITAKAKDYLTGFATELVSASGRVITDKPAAPAKGREPQNWGEYFGVDTNVA